MNLDIFIYIDKEFNTISAFKYKGSNNIYYI